MVSSSNKSLAILVVGLGHIELHLHGTLLSQLLVNTYSSFLEPSVCGHLAIFEDVSVLRLKCTDLPDSGIQRQTLPVATYASILLLYMHTDREHSHDMLS